MRGTSNLKKHASAERKTACGGVFSIALGISNSVSPYLQSICETHLMMKGK